MGPADTCLKISGSFSWGFTSNTPKKDAKKGASASAQKKVAEEKTEEVDQVKKLSKFVTLKNIKMEVKKGEFISIIGDVGSGKSSLLQALIGDMIYIP